MIGHRLRAAVAGTTALSAVAAVAAPPLRVIATIFPLYDWARVVGGSAAEVRQLLPPGAEVHGYTPSPADVAALTTADLFVYVGPDLEPWAERLDVRSGLGAIRRFAASRCLAPRPQGDPHFWTDPLAAAEVVRGIAGAMAEINPQGADGYRARADAYAGELMRLHKEFESMVASATARTIMLGGHAAFGALGQRYGISFVSPYTGFAPDAPPSPRAIAEMIERIKQTGTKVLFHEELIEPRVARTIARETGAELRLLHGLHNRTPEEARRDETYLALQRRNLAELRRVVCPP